MPEESQDGRDRIAGRPAEVADAVTRRRELFLSSRRDRKGNVLSGLFARALQQRQKAERGADGAPPPGLPPGPPGTVNWTPIGPSVIAAEGRAYAGRITALAVGPLGNRAYAGADNGGVWFTADGGAHWSPLDDYVVSPSGSHFYEDALSVGALAVRFGATAATDEIYEGTGGYSYYGIGVRHSTAGGAPGSWTLEATNLAGTDINALAIDPDTPALVFAATMQGIFRRPTAGSTATWPQVTSTAFANPNTLASSIIVAGSGATKRYYAAFYNDTVYSSPDGTTWTRLTGIAATSGRIALACGESDPSVVYAFSSQGVLYRLVGTAFQTVAGTPSAAILFSHGQGNFDLWVAVDPGNPSIVYLVGEDVGDLAFFRGTITGGPGTWNFGFTNTANPGADPTYVGSGVHADGHAMAFALNAAGTAHTGTDVWVGSDGGVWRSVMSGQNGSFVARNTGLAIAEINYLAQRYDTDAVVFGGTQDNGTVRYLGEQAWVQPGYAAGGDGGGVATDPANPYRVLSQYIHASLRASVDGGSSFSWLNFPPITANTPAQQAAAQAESNTATAFYSPIATTPPGAATTLAAFGTNRLWLTSDWGTSWVTLPTATNPYTPATPNATQDVIEAANPILAIAFASATRIFAATYQTIWRYDQVGATWTRTVIDTTALGNYRFITAIAVDDAASASFYVTLGGGGVPHVYHYDGATSTWTAAMPTSVIDAPAQAIAVDPSNPGTIYVGTDVGCWRGVRTGPTTWTWSVFSSGLPEATITDLKVHDQARLLRAATFGRGVWEISLAGQAMSTPDIYLRVDEADTGYISGGSRHAWVEQRPDPTKVGFNVYHWMSPDIKVRRGSLPGLPVLTSPVDYLQFAVAIGDYVDSTTDIETADISGSNRIFVQVHNRNPVAPVPAAQLRVLLLLADASAGLPPLPANYASHINAGDTSSAWLAGSGWVFADPMQPYRTPTFDLDTRTPQVVEYGVDFSNAIQLPAGHDHVCAAAFVTTASDPITATDTSLDHATMLDKHIAHRNLHLVAAGAQPIAGDEGGFRQSPEAVLLDFHNVQETAVSAEIVVESATFPGHLALVLPVERQVPPPKPEHHGFRLAGTVEVEAAHGNGAHHEDVSHLVERVRSSIARATEMIRTSSSAEEDALTPAQRRRLEAIAALDHDHVYVAEPGAHTHVLQGLRLPARGSLTAALIVEPPAFAKPGDRYAFHVIQRDGERIVGGSTYIVAVTRAAAARHAVNLSRLTEVIRDAEALRKE